jgi:hypothetical protein
VPAVQKRVGCESQPVDTGQRLYALIVDNIGVV